MSPAVEPSAEAGPWLSVVIPVFNEIHRMGSTLDAAAEVLPTFPFASEILVVDDGSDDGTAAYVEGRAPSSPVPLRVLREPHRGKGGAVRAGMLAAQGHYRLLFDADRAMEFSEIPRFLNEAESGADIIIGSRELAGSVRVQESGFRHLRGRIFNGVVRWIVGGNIRDTQCGYKLFSAEAAETIFRSLTIHGFAFDVEALLIARRRGYCIREIPIEWRHHPISKVRPLADVIVMTWSVIRIRWNDLRGRYRQNAATR